MEVGPTSTVIYIYAMSLVFFLVALVVLRALAARNADLAEALSFRSAKLRRAVAATT